MQSEVGPPPADGIRGEAGFTLIELLVVVVILGILMAIAIPTFLGLTGSAKANAAESDLTTAVQDEALYLTSNGSFGASTAGNQQAMMAADPGINWSAVAVPPAGSAGTKLVSINVTNTAAGAAAQVVLGTLGSDGNMYWIQDTGGSLLYLKTGALTAAPSSTAFTPNNTSWSALGGVSSPSSTTPTPSSTTPTAPSTTTATAPSSTTPTTTANSGTTATTTVSSASTTTTTPANNGVTATPSVNASPYYGTETLSLTNTSAMTALNVTISVAQTSGVNGAGQFVTIGNGAMNYSYSSDGTTIRYTFTQVPGSTIVPSTYQVAAQYSGNGAVRVTSGDTWTVTSTSQGVTSTRSGTF